MTSRPFFRRIPAGSIASLLVIAVGAGTASAQDSVPAVPLAPVVQIQLPAPLPGQPTGRINGRAIDRETGRPLSGLRVTISGATAVETDLDGRYRSLPLSPRTYTVRVAQIGYQPSQVDSVIVVEGRTTTADFAMQAVAISVEGITVEAAAVTAPSSEASLLALQQAAPNVSDGISAEAMSRTPDADAADAVTRVTGISVVDNKYVVVRGLPERYNNTLLNGAELSSPDPNRRVVPLDIFPASLLESIVATKTATPDRPGDFSGGSIEIRTREFPEEFVAQASVSQGYNSLTTFERLPVAPQSGWDILGFGAGRRRAHLPANGDPCDERCAESFRTMWRPVPTIARPNLGFSASLGGRRDLGQVPFGAALSFSYSSGTQHVPERLFSVFSGPPDQFPAGRSLLYNETRHNVDWGAIANFALRPGPNHKISWRNLYTHGAEEAILDAAGYDIENSRISRQFQVQYVEQSLLQTQLAGEHRLPGFLQSLFAWRGTLGYSRRNEPENRQADYQYVGGDRFELQSSNPSTMWIRDLTDRISSAALDWSVPFRLRTSGDAEFKVGGLYRVRDRDFFSSQFRVSVDISQPNADDVAGLPPDQAFAPENVGTVLRLTNSGDRAQPYLATDRVAAGYGMLDVFLLRGVRLVGGVRYEDWRLDITPLLNAADTVGLQHVIAAQPDLLWSGNLTMAIGPRTNLRFAAFRSVTRPDAREKTIDVAVPVAGACEVSGDTSVRRAAALNADARFEFYRQPGEIASISAFYKRFDQPIVETLGTPGGTSCRATTRNATSAENFGVELELRRSLLTPGLMVGVNLTFVRSRVVMPEVFGLYDASLPLAGQSPFLVNANVSWVARDGRYAVSLLFNRFASRVVRYGLAGSVAGAQTPNVYERGRNQLDGKLQVGVGRRTTVSLSARNLTDAVTEFYHPTPSGNVRQGFERSGVGVSMGLGYAF